MGRETKLNKTKIEKIDPKDTFDITTPSLEVNARRTDPYIDPGSPGKGNVAALMSFTKDINASLHSYGKIQNQKKGENAAKAKADELQGIYDKPSGMFNLGKGYDETWHTVHGEALAGQFKEEYTRKLKENNNFVDGDRTDEEARAERDKLFQETYQKYFKGVQSNYALAGASEKYHASKVEGIALSETAIAEKNVNTAITDVGMQGRTTVVDGVNNKDKSIGDIKREIQNAWTEIKPGYKAIMTRDKYTSIMINQIHDVIWTTVQNDQISTTEAKEKGDKLIALLKTPDDDGVSWNDITTEKGQYKFRHQIQAVEEMLDSELTKKEARDDKKLNKLQEMNKSKFTIELTNLEGLPVEEQFDQVKDIRQRANEMRSKGDLSMQDHDAILGYSERILKGDLACDPATEASVLRLAQKSQISLKEVERLFIQGKINASTRNSAYSSIDSHDKWAASYGQQQDAINREEYRFNLSMVKSANVVDPLSTDINAKQIAERKGIMMEDKYDLYVKEEKMSPASARVKVINEFDKLTPESVEETMGKSQFQSPEHLVQEYQRRLKMGNPMNPRLFNIYIKEIEIQEKNRIKGVMKQAVNQYYKAEDEKKKRSK